MKRIAALLLVALLAGCAPKSVGPARYAIEVGTDGLYNYVDREVPEPLATELERRIAETFWATVDGPPPWGSTWHRRPS